MPVSAFEKLPEEKRNRILRYGIHEFSMKPYPEVNTDAITKSCGISKGILFHYFGSKKKFYLYCVEQALKKLITDVPEPDAGDFYGIIFGSMDEKLSRCRDYPDETRLVNMAARETSSEVMHELAGVLLPYMAKVRANSARTMARAAGKLRLKPGNREKAIEALSLYVQALVNRYLTEYREKLDAFFQRSETIKAEMREYIDFMLDGIQG